MPMFTRVMPSFNVLIGTTALTFQVLVLYPWHLQLDEELKKLQQENERLANLVSTLHKRNQQP